MADNKVDGILLEIEATTDKADGGIGKVIKNLKSLKGITEEMDVKKLGTIRDVFDSFSSAGEGLKQAGSGMKSIVSSVKSLSSVNSAKLKGIADSIAKIGAGLGNLGSNNKINIRIDSEGIKKAVKPLEEIQNSSVSKKTIESYENFEKRIANIGKNFSFSGDDAELDKEISSLEAKLDSLLQKEEKLKNVDGIDKNSKAYRNLQYDITEVCNKLDVLYNKVNKGKNVTNDVAESYESFEERLKSVAQGFEFKGDTEQFSAEIQKLEDRLDSLLKKEEKIKTTEGINKDSSSYRSLQYDIAEVCNKLDILYERMQNSTSAEQNVVTVSQQASSAMNNVAQSVEQLVSAEEHMADAGNSAAESQNALKDSLDISSEADNSNSKIQNLINKINEYKSTISGMENGTKAFDAFDYEKAVKGLRRVQEEFNQYKENIKTTPYTMGDVGNTLQSIGEMADKAGLGTLSSILQGIGKILPTIQSGSIAASGGFQAMASALMGIQNAIPVIGIVLSLINGIVNVTKNAVNKLKGSFEKIIQWFKKLRSAVQGYIDKIRESFGIQKNTMGDMIKKLKSVTRLATFMLLRSAFTALFQNITASIELLARYSNNMGTEFNKNISLLVSDLKWLSNAFVTAFEPILNYVTPVLDFLVEKLVTASNALAQFFSALTGKKTWTRAVKNVTNYADSLESASKSAEKLKNQLLPIDELNILSDNNSGNGSSSNTLDNPGDYFTTEEVGNQFYDFADMVKEAWEKADFTEIGNILGKKLKESLDNIDWTGIKGKLEKIAKSIATFLNGFLGTPGLFSSIGTTIAEAINSAITFVRTSIYTLEWDTLGTAIGDMLGNAIAGMDYVGIAESFTGFVNGVFTAVLNFSKTYPWKQIALNFADGINAALDGLDWNTIKSGFSSFTAGLGNNLNTAILGINWSKLGQTLGNAVMTLVEGIGDFLAEIDFEEIGNQIASAINNAVKTIDWKKAGGTANSLITGICKLINTVIDEVDWFELMQGIGEALRQIDWYEVFKTVFKLIAAQWTFPKIFKATAIIEIGTSIIGGIKEGISEAISNIGDWIYNTLAKPFIDKIKEAFGISGDKSGVMDEVGRNVTGGFLEGIVTSWGDPLPVKISNLVSGLIDGFKSKLGIHSPSTVFDEIGQNTVQGFLGGIDGKLSSCQETILGWAGSVKEWFSGTSFGSICEGTWTNFANNIITGFDNTVGSSFPSTKGNITTWANKLKTWFDSSSDGGINKTTWTGFANNIISGFKAKIGNSYSTTKGNLTAWTSALKTWFSGDVNNNQWSTYAGNIISGFKNKIGNSYTETKGNIQAWAEKVKDWFKNIASPDAFKNIAKNVVDGFRNGIGTFYTNCRDKIENWATKASTWFKNKLDINSPSKLFQSFAGYTVEGFNQGIEKEGTSTKGIVQSWADSFTDFKVGFKVGVDTSELSNYQNNYGSDFTTDAIVERVNREVSTNGTVDAVLNSGGGLKQALSEVVTEEVLPMLVQIATNTGQASNQDIYIDGRKLFEVVKERNRREVIRTGYSPLMG